MSDIGAGFPKPLAFNYLKRLQGGFSKTTVKILPDNQTANPNNVIRFKVSGSGLWDFRSFAMYFKATCKQDATANENYKIHCPRYASSFIENLTISANNTSIFSTVGYNYLYSKIHDMEGADISQYAKRNASGDNFDPSINFTVGTATETDDTTNQLLTITNNLISHDGTNAVAGDTDKLLCVNNWLFFNSLSTPIIDLSMIGDLYITITFAPASILFRSASTVATISTTLTNPTYTLKDIYATCDRISFSDPTYYEMLAQKLLGDGVYIGYHDYYFSSFGTAKKKSGINLNWTVNSASLDKVLLALKHKQSTDGTVYPLVLYGTNQNTTTTPNTTYKTWTELISAYHLYENTTGTVITSLTGFGDFFNNSMYFVSSGANLSTSKWSLNSVDIDTYGVPPIEVFNKYLKHDNFNNLDAGSGTVHAGCPSLYHFLKYYYVDSLDLTLQTGNDPNMFVSGLNGAGSGLNIAWSGTFDSSADATVQPVAWCRSTKILKIGAGRSLQIDPPVVY